MGRGAFVGKERSSSQSVLCTFQAVMCSLAATSARRSVQVCRQDCQATRAESAASLVPADNEITPREGTPGTASSANPHQMAHMGLNGGRPVPIIRAAMHAHTASDRQPAASALVLSVLSVAAIVAVTVSIIGIVIIRPSARGVLG